MYGYGVRGRNWEVGTDIYNTLYKIDNVRTYCLTELMRTLFNALW